MKVIYGEFKGNRDAAYSWILPDSLEAVVGDLAVVENRNGIEIVKVVDICEEEIGEDDAVSKKKVISIIPATQAGDALREWECDGTPTGVISPTRGVEYTIYDVLMKGKKRSTLSSEQIRIERVLKTSYGDADYLIHIKNFRCSRPVWQNSVSFNIPEVIVPCHVKGGTDNYQLEWNTLGSWEDSEKEEKQCSNISWYRTYYSKIYVHYIEVILGDERESVYNSRVVDEKEVHFSEKEMNLLSEIVKSHVLSEMFLKASAHCGLFI